MNGVRRTKNEIANTVAVDVAGRRNARTAFVYADISAGDAVPVAWVECGQPKRAACRAALPIDDEGLIGFGRTDNDVTDAVTVQIRTTGHAATCISTRRLRSANRASNRKPVSGR